jgi:tetratricopeptide (TPR) repeat protein
MRMLSQPRQALLALAWLILLGTARPLPAADDPLRQRALKLNDVTGTKPQDGEVRVLTADADGTRKLLAVAVRMIKEKPQPFAYNATLILAEAADRVEDYAAAEKFYRLHSEQALKLLSSEGLAVAYDGLTRALYNGKKYDECEKACEEFIGIEGDEAITKRKSLMLQRLILAQARQGKAEDALGVIDRILKNSPDNWAALELKGRVLRLAGKTEEALKLYEDLIDRIKKDKKLKDDVKEELVDDFRYALSGLYVDMGDIDKAAEQLKTLLARKPDDPTYNNDLGFVWADHDKNLAESEKLVRKALAEDRKQRRKANPDLKPEADKDNPAYLDSLGWVLFKQKKYKEALEPLLAAVKEKDGQHLEIYDHLAEVYMALGQKAEAVAAWKKGLKTASTPVGKREQQLKVAVEKKLKANE